MVYGDAGIDPLLPHLLPMAQSLEVLSTDRIPSGRIEEDLQSFDTILIQTTESGIQDLRIDLDRVFEQLVKDAAPVTFAPVDLSAVKPMANTALHPRDEGLEVKSLGARSTFAIIDLPGSYRRCLRVLRLTLSALQPDTMTVTCQTNPPIQVEKLIPPGRFNLYLPLPVRSTVTLRFQPGDYAGLLVLQHAEIIGFPEGDSAACGRPDIVLVDHSVRPMGEEVAIDERPLDAGSEKPETAAKMRGSTTDGSVAGGTIPRPTASGSPTLAPAAIAARSASPGAENLSSAAREQAENLPANTLATAKAPEPVRAAKVGSTIVLNDFADGRIFQRQNRQADIVVSGVYTGTVSGIEARVVRHGTVDAIIPWTVIDDAPNNGIFLGLLPGVPEGGWYALEVRATDDHTNGSTGQNPWGVGILMACIGQSNMKEWFFTGTDLTAHPLLRRYTDSGWQTLDGRGNGAIACGNRLIARTGVPVGLIEYAVNGSGLHRKADWGTGYWEDTRPGSIYRRFLSGVAATGGRLEFVLWIQGSRCRPRHGDKGGLPGRPDPVCCPSGASGYHQWIDPTPTPFSGGGHGETAGRARCAPPGHS